MPLEIKSVVWLKVESSIYSSKCYSKCILQLKYLLLQTYFQTLDKYFSVVQEIRLDLTIKILAWTWWTKSDGNWCVRETAWAADQWVTCAKYWQLLPFPPSVNIDFLGRTSSASPAGDTLLTHRLTCPEARCRWHTSTWWHIYTRVIWVPQFADDLIHSKKYFIISVHLI